MVSVPPRHLHNKYSKYRKIRKIMKILIIDNLQKAQTLPYYSRISHYEKFMRKYKLYIPSNIREELIYYMIDDIRNMQM